MQCKEEDGLVEIILILTGYNPLRSRAKKGTGDMDTYLETRSTTVSLN